MLGPRAVIPSTAPRRRALDAAAARRRQANARQGQPELPRPCSCLSYGQVKECAVGELLQQYFSGSWHAMLR
eukprot:4079674-Pleurochrysis_carterae.AAC.1